VPELQRRPTDGRDGDRPGTGSGVGDEAAPVDRPPGDADADRTGDRTTRVLHGQEAADVVELLDDDYARSILAALDDRSRAAAELVEECDASSPTVYRRLNRLQEHGLVAVGLSLSTDGHHRKVYRSTFAELSTRLGSDGLEAELVLED
jgi:DNA-binding HxlR family transcriptional regulator